VIANFCALSLQIKFQYLLFQSSGFYNKEKLKPVLGLQELLSLSSLLLLPAAVLKVEYIVKQV